MLFIIFQLWKCFQIRLQLSVKKNFQLGRKLYDIVWIAIEVDGGESCANDEKTQRETLFKTLELLGAILTF